MMHPGTLLPDVFDNGHYASTLPRKIKRSLELGPKYYLLDLPRYLRRRKALKLSPWDLAAFWNPAREFRRKPYTRLDLPPGYPEALGRLREAGVRLTMPAVRLEGLLGCWWSVRDVRGDAIECGSYRGATALLLAVLGQMHGLRQSVLMLDTFRGMPVTSRFDLARTAGEFNPPADQVETIRRQAEALGVADRVEVHQGLFAETFERLKDRPLRYAFVHIDANIYQGTWEACQFAIPRTAPGGAVAFDDYNGVCDLGARLAIDRYCADHGLTPAPLAGSSAWVRMPPTSPAGR